MKAKFRMNYGHKNRVLRDKIMKQNYKELIRQLKSCVFTVIYPELAGNAATAIQLLTEQLSDYEDNAIIFPQTIGNLTYYSKEELFEWVEYQQKINDKINKIYEKFCNR